LVFTAGSALIPGSFGRNSDDLSPRICSSLKGVDAGAQYLLPLSYPARGYEPKYARKLCRTV